MEFTQINNKTIISSEMAIQKKFKIFDAARLRFEELRNDITDYIKGVYVTEGTELTSASPLMQVLTVIAHLGRMILFYIESAMNETNMETAVHDRSIKGLSVLTGHNPSRGIAARGAVELIYNRSTEYSGETLTIANLTSIKNKDNGLNYLIVLPGDTMQYTIGYTASNIEVSIIQGELRYQQATGTGASMQSFSFNASNLEMIDNFYVNVYVNIERWKTVESIMDMTYNEKACIVKTGANGGVDVFFGNGMNGMIPEQGVSIKLEYLVCAGADGNVALLGDEDSTSWEFVDNGSFLDGSAVDLNGIFKIVPSTDIVFGADPETISMTRALAPHASRSFVLANNINYEYFLRKLNMFSVIDTIQGFNSYEDREAKIKYDLSEKAYVTAREEYLSQVKLTGEKSKASQEKYDKFIECSKELDKAKINVENTKLDDNIIYLFLIPRLESRMNETNNYFTCSKKAFYLSDSEKDSILDLLDNSGQKMLTVDNAIIDPKMPKFAINIFIQMWDDYTFENVKSDIISAVSDYLIANTRRDRIPVSDFIRIVEGVSGVDSVSIFFDADKENTVYYGEGNYGIDEFGDIVLERQLTDSLGNKTIIKDLFPLFRGPFTSSNGISYSDDLSSLNCPINVTLRGKSKAGISDKIKLIK